MKIIDKTPLLNEKGELGIVENVQGMLRFGFNWPNELVAQKAIMTFFERQLEKGYTLIRNMTLGKSGIMIPIILLGPAGIFVIQVSYLRGRYEAKGKSWNVESGNQYKPAPVNIIQHTARMARALQVYIERQGVELPAEIEPVVIAGDPGLHIESVRPAIRVLMIDGIRSFVSGLASGRAVMGAEAVFELTERILNPRPPKKGSVAPPAPAARVPSEQEEPVPQQPNVSRARTIFSASEQVKPFDPADFDFAMVDEPPADAIPPLPASRETNPATPIQRPAQKNRRILGMTLLQLIIVVALGLCFLCVIVVGFVYVIPLVS